MQFSNTGCIKTIPLATDSTGDSASAFAICEAGNRDPVEESDPSTVMRLEVRLPKDFQISLHGASRPRLPHVESKQASPNQVRCYLEKVDLLSVAYFQKDKPHRSLKPGVRRAWFRTHLPRTWRCRSHAGRCTHHRAPGSAPPPLRTCSCLPGQRTRGLDWQGLLWST